MEHFFSSNRQFPYSPERNQRGKARIICKRTQEEIAQLGRKLASKRERDGGYRIVREKGIFKCLQGGGEMTVNKAMS